MNLFVPKIYVEILNGWSCNIDLFHDSQNMTHATFQSEISIEVLMIQGCDDSNIGELLALYFRIQFIDFT